MSEQLDQYLPLMMIVQFFREYPFTQFPLQFRG